MDKFIKNDKNKPRPSLLPIKAKQKVIEVLEFGSVKYGANNWKLCKDKTRYIDAAMRHIDEYLLGNVLDDESKQPHLAHAIASLMFVLELDDKIND